MNSLETVKAVYQAFEAKDMATLFSLLAPTAEVYQTPELPWGGDYRGVPEVKDFLGKLFSHIESTVEMSHYLVPGDNKVVAVGTTQGHVKSTGKKFRCNLVHIWTVQDGIVTRFEVYIDTSWMKAALDS